MKKQLLFILSLIFSLNLSAQIKAVTETGEEVTLYDDGTYVYVNGQNKSTAVIPTNNRSFSKSQEATFLLKSKRIDVGFWLDPKKWSFSRSKNNEDAEYEVQFKGEDLYGVIITEKIAIPLENLKNIFLDNAASVAPDRHVVQEEYREVNGEKVLFLQVNGTMQGMKIAYYGYLSSGDFGTVQFITYTSQNLLKEYQPESEKLINGLVRL